MENSESNPKLIEFLARLLWPHFYALLLQELESPGGLATGGTNVYGAGVRKKRRAKRTHAAPRTVSEDSILAMFKEQGPLQIKRVAELTGLSLSSAHKKVKALKAAKALKPVREGTTVMYMAVRGGRARRTSDPSSTKKKRRSQKKKKKTAVGEVTASA